MAVSPPAVVLGLLTVALYVIARTTGAGWVVVMLCGLLGLAVVATVTPVVALVPVRVTASAPRDARVGRPLSIQVALHGRARALRLRTLVPAGAWIGTDAPAGGEVRVVPQQRGVLHDLVLEVRAAGPVGFVTWARVVRLRLEHPVEVAPRPTTARFEPPGGARTSTTTTEGGASGADLTRGVRDHLPGDPMRLVHWPATARSGALMVRELEGPHHALVVVIVDLRGDPDAAEATASRAFGFVIAALAYGSPVELRTAEADGPRTGRIAGVTDAGRRLARAVAGAPTTTGLPPGADVRRIVAGAGPSR